MVRRNIVSLPIVWLVAILALLITNPAYTQTRKADSNLTVSISRTDKQWGQPLRVTLRYRGSQLLENIDLQPWQQLVAIDREDEYIDEDNNGNLIQVLQLRLQPRNTGAFQLPSLKLGSAHSQPIDINISQAIIKNAAIELDWQISTLSPWQRQAVILRVQVKTSDYAAHIKLDPPAHQQFLSRSLKTERHVLADGGYRLDAGWILYPIDTGSLTLDLPPVRYQVAGSDRRQFYLPLQKLQVKALPNYLPPTLPVGKLNVRSQINSADNDDDKQWQLFIQSDALIPYGVPELDTQLAAISGQDIANVGINYTQQSDYSEYGDRSIYLAPLPNWLLPFGKNIKLTLRYFDTETGRLGELSHDLPRHWNMPLWAWWLMSVFSLITGAFIIRQIQASTQAQINRLKLRRQLRSATNARQLRKIILADGQYVTLSEWAKKNQARKPAISELNQYCFSASGPESTDKADIQKLTTRLLKLV